MLHIRCVPQPELWSELVKFMPPRWGICVNSTINISAYKLRRSGMLKLYGADYIRNVVPQLQLWNEERTSAKLIKKPELTSRRFGTFGRLRF